MTMRAAYPWLVLWAVALMLQTAELAVNVIANLI